MLCYVIQQRKGVLLSSLYTSKLTHHIKCETGNFILNCKFVCTSIITAKDCRIAHHLISESILNV